MKRRGVPLGNKTGPRSTLLPRESNPNGISDVWFRGRSPLLNGAAAQWVAACPRSYSIKRWSVQDNGKWQDIDEQASTSAQEAGERLSGAPLKPFTGWFPWWKPVTLQIPWKRSQRGRLQQAGCVSEHLSHRIRGWGWGGVWFLRSLGCDFHKGNLQFCICRSRCGSQNPDHRSPPRGLGQGLQSQNIYSW